MKLKVSESEILLVALFTVGTLTALLANKSIGIVLAASSQVGFLASAYRTNDLQEARGGLGAAALLTLFSLLLVNLV